MLLTTQAAFVQHPSFEDEMTQNGEMFSSLKGDRIEYNHVFRWDDTHGRWETTEGRKVYVNPAGIFGNFWRVNIPSTGVSHDLTGEDVEARAFCIAEVYSRQQ
jgi:hypothetical protein